MSTDPAEDFEVRVILEESTRLPAGALEKELRMNAGVREVAPITIEQLRAHEIEEARKIQRAMVSVEPLQAHPVEISCRFRPALEVGGDFLDYFWLAEGKLGLYVGDVVGKGLPAAMYAALAVGTLRGIHKRGTPPTAVLQLMNERLRTRVVPGRFCAVQYAVFDADTLEMRYSNAGLPRPLLIARNGCRELGEGGLPSGMFPSVSYDQYGIQLEPGDAILFATDGILEARNTHDDDFGVTRLMTACEKSRNGSAESLLTGVFAELDSFIGNQRPQDDMTAVVLKIRE